ncbi:cytochrome c3 family protein [Neobacillus sp. OS1-2]|uniref:cytochrome c3 family protein n=1 Tax=Neobacillus sp. OS1-2 TaxID=3070680 RepID=UPI0027E04379|nr:cytochrome c3 family protein [Neobacillus sp. OS1-2]WML41186.1 cytochrome c3 family protein [Neobacillus sp. OS1-2]
MRKFSFSLLFAIMLLGMFAAAASAATTMNPGQKGTSITNANETGKGVDDATDGSEHDNVVKALSGQNVHTSYQNNTNSCASCHQTHTAKGDSLLFADDVYNTCTACHDGTLGFANVFASGETAKMTGAGTFGGTHGASQHQANDSMKISAAPGGNHTEGSKTSGTGWGENFNCASCHAPHGSYSDRLLAYNPNGIASMPASQGGMQLENVTVYDQTAGQTIAEALAGKTDAVVLLRSTDANSVVTVAQYNKGTSGYTKSEAPWLYGYDNRTDGKSYWSRLMENDTTVAAYGSTSGVYFDYEHAQAYSTSPAGATALGKATKGFLARPVVVKMEKNGHEINQAAYFSGSTVAKMGVSEQKLKDLGYKVSADGKVTDIGVAMSKFCAACHTDYLTASGTKSTHFEAENAAYRHSTNSDSYTCVRCHYGHGTDAYIMKDSLGNTIKSLVDSGAKTDSEALNYMQDNNASSALKKFTNMSVCWACHNSSHAESIKNTERSADHPNGMPSGY